MYATWSLRSFSRRWISRCARRRVHNFRRRIPDRGLRSRKGRWVMRRLVTLSAAIAAGLVSVYAQSKPMTKQAERGKELFLNSPKGIACGACHTMAGVGTDVGPDLKVLASVVPPRGMVAAIQMTMAERVQEVKT